MVVLVSSLSLLLESFKGTRKAHIQCVGGNLGVHETDSEKEQKMTIRLLGPTTAIMLSWQILEDRTMDITPSQSVYDYL